MADYDSMNLVILIGRVGRIYEVKYSEGTNLATVRFSLATSGKDRNKKIHTDWHYVTAFGTAAEFVRDYVKVGDRLGIKGRNSEKRWQTEGVWQRSYAVHAINIILFRGAEATKDREPGPQDEEPLDEEAPPF